MIKCMHDQLKIILVNIGEICIPGKQRIREGILVDSSECVNRCRPIS